MALHLTSYVLPAFRTLNLFPKSQFFRFSSTTGQIDPLVQSLYEGICNRDRASLARSITLVESLHPKKRHQGRQLIETILNKQRSQADIPGFRIGLSGPPGTGKSTFIEVFGKMLTDNGHRVAVLTVDPSSVITGGSLLGDKTRMTLLSRDMNAFIRPSPTGGTLGGVTRSTNEAILLCEASGFDIVLVETVGVGQSETAVADMVDLFLLLIPPAGGDELQGMKRGIVELADIIAVTKADGDLEDAAKRIQSEYMSAIRITRRKTVSWKPKVMRMSSRTKVGIDDLLKKINEFREVTMKSGDLLRKRTEQRRIWMWKYIENDLMNLFRTDERVRSQIHGLEERVQRGEISPGTAADTILAVFLNRTLSDGNY